jgi:hypothetical protein
MRNFVNFLLAMLFAVALQEKVVGQGHFLATNCDHGPNRPPMQTRLYTPDGPFAGETIYGQSFVGLTPDSLSPVGPSLPHTFHPGCVYGGAVSVPGIFDPDLAYFQMIAWDGEIWGSSFQNVPSEWQGKTDVVLWSLEHPFLGTPRGPHFTVPAIVPVPEPGVLSLAFLAAAILMGRTFFRKS